MYNNGDNKLISVLRRKYPYERRRSDRYTKALMSERNRQKPCSPEEPGCAKITNAVTVLRSFAAQRLANGLRDRNKL